MPLPQFSDFVSVPPVRRLREATHSQGRTASGDRSGGGYISRPGFRSGDSTGFRSNARICKFHAADQCQRTRSFLAWRPLCCKFLHVPTVGPGTAASTLPTTHPESVAESYLHIGDVIVPRQDKGGGAICGRPACGTGLRLSRHLLPGPFGEECILQTRELSPISLQ